jgi:hypothetical protein
MHCPHEEQIIASPTRRILSHVHVVMNKNQRRQLFEHANGAFCEKRLDEHVQEAVVWNAQ